MLDTDDTEPLRGAVAVCAALVAAGEPQGARACLLYGLVGQVGVSAAALWRAATDADDNDRLIGAVGLPHDVRRRLASCSVDDDGLEAAWPDRELRRVTIPEPASGTLCVWLPRPAGQGLDELLATLAGAYAAVVHQATLRARARTVIDSLQRELRPRRLDVAEGLQIGTFYQSATLGVEVGGDFYDVFATDSGHVGIACGDVSGKGVEAASLTAMAVYSLRAYALQGTTPGVALSMLNTAVHAQTSAERFITMAYVRLDPVTWTGTVTLAGHPPPLLVASDRVELLDVPADLPLGVDANASYAHVDFRLGAGDSLLLYTDGVTEARRHDEDGNVELLGIPGLIEVASALRAGDAQQLADGVWEAVQAWTDHGTADDCAVVVVRRLPAG